MLDKRPRSESIKKVALNDDAATKLTEDEHSSTGMNVGIDQLDRRFVVQYRPRLDRRESWMSRYSCSEGTHSPRRQARLSKSLDGSDLL